MGAFVCASICAHDAGTSVRLAIRKPLGTRAMMSASSVIRHGIARLCAGSESCVLDPGGKQFCWSRYATGARTCDCVGT
jgi:hypothetical protein